MKGLQDRLIRAAIAAGIMMVAGIFSLVALGLLIATLYLGLEEVMEAWQAMGLTALVVLLVALILLLVARSMTSGGKRRQRRLRERYEQEAALQDQAASLQGAASPGEMGLRLFTRWTGGHAREGVLSMFAVGVLLGSLPEARALLTRGLTRGRQRRKRRSPPAY